MRQTEQSLRLLPSGGLRQLSAFMLVMALAAATLVPTQAQAQGQPAPSADGMALQHGAQRTAHYPQGGHDGMMRSERMLDSVGASAEQKARVREILKASQDERLKQREGTRALRQQMMQLLAAPQIDSAAAEALRQQQQARHDAASKRMLQTLLDVSAVLTPEQRAKMAEQMKARQEMMGRHQRERQSLQAPRS